MLQVPLVFLVFLIRDPWPPQRQGRKNYEDGPLLRIQGAAQTAEDTATLCLSAVSDGTGALGTQRDLNSKAQSHPEISPAYPVCSGHTI